MRNDDPFNLRVTRRELLRLMSLSAAAGLVSCGAPADPNDDDDDDDGGGLTLAPGTSRAGAGTPGAPVTSAQRKSAFIALETKLVELLDSTTGKAPAGQVLAWLAQQGVYQTIGYSATRDVYAIFTDGRPHLITTDSRMGTDGVTKAPTGPPPVLQLHSAGSMVRETGSAPQVNFEAGLPGKWFRFINTWYAEPTPDFGPIDTWCDANRINVQNPLSAARFMEKFGYDIVFGQDGFLSSGISGEVESLKSNVKGDGVFYWGTHGGRLDPAGIVIQGLMTSTPAYQQTVEVDYADEFAQGTLIYYTAPLCPMGCGLFRPNVQSRLAITDKWIKKYQWKFGDYSLVFVNACLSGTGPIKQAFLDAGASVYMGWNNVVRFWAVCGSAYDFFSLMLGLNANMGGVSPGFVEPRQRPYDWGAVLFHLQRSAMTGAYSDPEEGIVTLQATPNFAVPSSFLCLRPSMYWNAFDEVNSELHLIGGMFGTNQGTAAIGTDVSCKTDCSVYDENADFKLASGVALTVKDWQSQNVVLEVPRTGPGSAGIVQVTVDGRFSNGAQLTRLNFPVTATQRHGGSLQVNVNAQLLFRGDFRGVRIDPMQELSFLDTVLCLTPAALTGNFTALGAHTYQDGDTTVVVEWSGSGTVLPSAATGGSLVIGEVKPKPRSGKFSVFLSGTGIMEKVTATTPGSPPSMSTREIGFTIESQRLPGLPPHSMEVQFAEAYTSPAVNQALSITGAGYNGADVTTTITIGPFTADFPPDKEVGGR